MRATFSLFPWDVIDDPDAAPRLARAGVERVALALVYHGARVATPQHPARRILDVPHSAAYIDGVEPLPRGEFDAVEARGALERAGIVVDGWAVLHHLDGDAGPPRVLSAFGDHLSHAACLSRPETRSYEDAVLAAVLGACAGRRLYLEAVGWQGLGHGSLHDKIGGADFSPRAQELLATCVCDACCAAADLEPGLARRAVRAELDDPERHDPAVVRLGRARAATQRRIVADIARRAAQAGVDLVLAHRDDPAGRLVDCWGRLDEAVSRLRAARELLRAAPRAYVELLASHPAAWRADWRALAEAGAEEFLVYHAGLVSEGRLHAAVAALRGENLSE